MMNYTTTLLYVALIGGFFALITSLISALIISRKERRNWENETAMKFIEYSLSNTDIAKKVARQFSVAVLIQIDDDDSTIEKHFLPAFCRFSIGRNNDHDICIDDKYLSRDHGLFYYSNGSMFYKDTSAKNATYINNKILNHRRKLKSGDLLLLGATRMRYEKL